MWSELEVEWSEMGAEWLGDELSEVWAEWLALWLDYLLAHQHLLQGEEIE